MEPYVYVI